MAIMQGLKEISRALEQGLIRPRVAYIAPLRTQAKAVAWHYLKHYCRNIPDAKINESELTITFLRTGAEFRLYGADNPDALRGLYFDFVILDEVAQMKADVWDEIIQPCIMDRRGRVLVIGTPKGYNLFYKLYLDAVKGDDWFVAVYPASKTGIIPDDELESRKRTMPDNKYRQEMECDFSASTEDTLITIDLAAPAMGKYLHPISWSRMPKVIGVDVARFGDDKTVICKRQGKMVFELIKVKGMDTIVCANRVAHEINDFNPDAVFLDGGYNPGVIDTLRSWKHIVTEVKFGARARDENEYSNVRTEIWDTLRLELESGLSLPDDDELLAEIVAATYTYDKKGRKILEPKEKMKERLNGASPDCGDAVALTFTAPVTNEILQFESVIPKNKRKYKYEVQL
jgi:hypothetical protein